VNLILYSKRETFFLKIPISSKLDVWVCLTTRTAVRN